MRPPLIVLFLVATLGLSACTDDNEPSGSSASSPTARPEASSPSETAASDLPPARDACTVLDREEVGRVLGTPVESVAAGQGCRFANPDDPETTSLGISQVELAKIGGIDGAKAGIGAVVEGRAEDLKGVGDSAFVVVGPTFGGTSGSPTAGAGAVALGSSLIQITVLAPDGATDEQVRGVTVDVLTLIAERARR